LAAACRRRGGDIFLAEQVARKLAGSKRFRVLSQQKIARQIQVLPILKRAL
jgi:hypothetical protein